MIQTILKCVLLICSLNLHFLFNGDTELKRMSSIVKVIAHVLSDKRSKHSVVGTKTPKKQYIFEFCRFRRSFTWKQFPPKSPSMWNIFLFFHESIFEHNPVIGYEVNSTLKLEIFSKVQKPFFLIKLILFSYTKYFFHIWFALWKKNCLHFQVRIIQIRTFFMIYLGKRICSKYSFW